MAVSFVDIRKDCVTEYTKFKLKPNASYIIYKIFEGREIIVDKIGDKDMDHNAFLAALPAKECRYAVFNLHYDIEEGKRSKLVFTNWCPDETKLREKLLYATNTQELKKELPGCLQVQANCIEDLSIDTLMNTFGKKFFFQYTEAVRINLYLYFYSFAR